MTHILDMFRKSPFEPLYEHRLKVQDSVVLVRPLFQAVFAGNANEQKRISEQIVVAEKAADALKDEIRRIVPKAVFLPVNREDLLRYLKIQDDLSDTVEDIMVLLSFKQIQTPPELAAAILEYVDVVLHVCTLSDQATDRLRPLVESGFGGEDARVVISLVEQMDVAEREADIAELTLVRRLFSLEDKMKPSDLMLWFRILDLVGDLADYSENTGELLRNMLAR